MRLPRPCLGCGEPTTNGSRCETCADAYVEAAYGGGWPALSKRERKAEPWCHCEGCSLHEGLCGSTERLTLGHLVPVARGGTAAMGTQVECQRCNTAKRDRIAGP